MSASRQELSLTTTYSQTEWLQDLRFLSSLRGLFDLNTGATLEMQGLDPEPFWRRYIEAVLKNDARSEAEIDRATITKLWTHYTNAVAGDLEATWNLWFSLTPRARYCFIVHMWNLRKEGAISAAVWGVILGRAWSEGQPGCLLMEEGANQDVISEMFVASCKPTLMGAPGEHDRFLNLPESFVIWRGTNDRHEFGANGFSWSLSRDQAEWFSYVYLRRGDIPILHKAIVRKTEVLASFELENEIVVIPDRGLDIVETVTLQCKLTELRKRMARLDTRLKQGDLTTISSPRPSDHIRMFGESSNCHAVFSSTGNICSPTLI